MMNSLFETFDPLSSTMNFNMTIICISIMVPTTSFYFTNKSRQNKILENLKNYMFSELEASTMNMNKQNKTFIMFTCFMLIVTLNISGLMPYVYTMSSQMMFTLSLAMPIWLSIIMFSMTMNTSHFLSHMVPLSTPLALSQFMTIIESISQLIRPITLSVRLCANMTAGHILMALTSSSLLIMGPMSSALMMLLTLEIAVAFIQSYVFTMLISMYMSETE